MPWFYLFCVCAFAPPFGMAASYTKSPVKRCSDIKTCDACLKDPRCGWCDDGSRTGLGTCMEGGDDGPVNVNPTATRGIIPGVHPSMDSIVGNGTLEMCHQNRWHFTACPECQCHGHAVCPLDSNECSVCGGNAEGDHCQSCKDGFWGEPKLGNNCTACECNHQAVTCDRENGRCFCKTKGIVGDKCQSCGVSSHYFGNPLNGSCFYQLKPEYRYLFNLSRPEDIHYTQINFQNMPPKPRKDVEFTLYCSQECKFNITFRSLNINGERLILTGTCSQKLFEKKFKATQHHFGDPFNTTFFVYVYDFQGSNKARFHLKISFLQNVRKTFSNTFSLVKIFKIFISTLIDFVV